MNPYTQLSLINSPSTHALVDSTLLETLSQHNWLLMQNGYCSRRSGGLVIYLHKEVLGLTSHTTEAAIIDHVNGNKLDNRACNLRYADKSQNMCNRGKTRGNTSGYKGVVLHRQSGKWRAYIKKDYKQHYLGIYETREQAASAYNAAAIRLHGEFALLNQI
jgi:hypothetical protein